jgi:hypothetical protein
MAPACLTGNQVSSLLHPRVCQHVGYNDMWMGRAPVAHSESTALLLLCPEPSAAMARHAGGAVQPKRAASKPVYGPQTAKGRKMLLNQPTTTHTNPSTAAAASCSAECQPPVKQTDTPEASCLCTQKLWLPVRAAIPLGWLLTPTYGWYQLSKPSQPPRERSQLGTPLGQLSMADSVVSR